MEKLGGDANAGQARLLVANVVAAPRGLHLLQGSPLLTVPTNVLTSVFTDEALLWRLATLGVLYPTSLADITGPEVQCSVIRWSLCSTNSRSVLERVYHV